jgi:hypothetical protein
MIYATQLTILRNYGSSSFTVVSQHAAGQSVAQDLNFDEMLGYIARLLCPTDSSGQPCMHAGRPLYLLPPTEPDAGQRTMKKGPQT